MSNFYSVDNWEMRENTWVESDVLIHVPCDHEVHQAMVGDKWVCTGCYEEPPEPILDVIRLGKPYKGRGTSSPNWQPSTGTGYSFYLPAGFGFYSGPGAPGNTSFYLSTVMDPIWERVFNDAFYAVQQNWLTGDGVIT